MKYIITAGVAALALVPAVAQAHTAKITCETETGRWTVIADYQHLNPSYLFDQYGVTVTWSDGYRVRKLYPGTCVAPPPAPLPPSEPVPAPAPVPVEETPSDIEPLPVVIVPNPDKPPVKRITTTVSKRVYTKKVVGCGKGVRPYSIQRTVVTWKRLGNVVKVKSSGPRKVYTKIVCRPPRVTG